MEILDIVDQNDNIIGQAPKDDAYENKLGHRIVHVLIFNDQKKIVLQLRSANVSFCPLHWSTTVGGHVQAGETYEQAAIREYEEELCTKSKLEILGKDLYQVKNRPDKFLMTFTSTFNGPFNPDQKVVEKVDFFSLPEIKTMIENKEKFHPELLFILKKYFFPD